MTADAPGIAGSVRWPDEDGPWSITAHWAKIDGRLVIVGLDLRSFHDEDLGAGTTARLPISDQLAEVTQRVLRGIPISSIRDRIRQQLVHKSEATMFAAARDEDLAEHGEWAADRLTELTAKGEPRQRRQPAGEDLLRQVAKLYEQALAQGDKMPAKFVEESLRAAGEPRLSTKGGRVLVRQWIRRARERGYLAAPTPRGEGL